MAKRIASIEPNVGEYHHMLGCLQGFEGDFSSAQRSIERALELEANPDWIYDKGSTMRLQTDHDPAALIATYEVVMLLYLMRNTNILVGNK